MASGAALALSVILIAWAAIMRLVTGTWLQPGSFFALFWCFAGILPLVLAPQEPVGVNVIFWLLAAGIAVSIGGALGNGGLKTRRPVTPEPGGKIEMLIFSWILVVSVLLGLGSSLAFMKSQSLAFSDLFDLQKLVVASNQAYFQRYGDAAAASPPALVQALLPFVYLAPAVGGAVFELRGSKMWKAVALTGFLPAVAVTVLQTTKAAVLFAIVLWLSSYFAMRLRFGKLSVFTKGHIAIATIVGGFLAAFFFAVSLARLASTDVALANVVLLKLTSAAFGHMTVFSQWLTQYWNESFDPTLGAVSFAGPLEMLGIGHRIPGLFESIIDLVAGETSNIYTAFRPLIQDFTIPGALLILTFLGFVGGVGFRLQAMGRRGGFPLLLIAYVTIFWSPITWFWIYNSLTATVVAVGMIVFLVRLWRRSRVTKHSEGLIAGTT